MLYNKFYISDCLVHCVPAREAGSVVESRACERSLLNLKFQLEVSVNEPVTLRLQRPAAAGAGHGPAGAGPASHCESDHHDASA